MSAQIYNSLFGVAYCGRTSVGEIRVSGITVYLVESLSLRKLDALNGAN